jgi:aminoglycoside phosphotransferase (APT) family kinase protein
LVTVTDNLQEQLQHTLGDSYRIERELGGGGMSRVFVALETAFQRPVVVKVLLPELAAGVSVERFRREIYLAAQLQHPHIVPLHSAGESEGLPYFTMPYVDGESLRARLLRERELPVPEAIRVLRDVASALAYAHERGVVHRDIKPDNVLLSRGVAVVTDFGVAKALTVSSEYGQAPPHPGLTSLGVTLGTPHYMAPEQGAGDPAMDHRVDIYAFGAMAYEILSGDPPFTGNSPHAILGGHIAGIAKPITSLRPGLPPLLGHIVMQCLEKRPADRPQSADELIRSLDALATPSGGTVPLQPISGTVALRPTARSRARWPALAAIAVVLLVIGATFAWLRGPEPPEAPVVQAPASPPAPAAETPAPPAPNPALDTFRPETTRAQVRREPSPEELALLNRLKVEAAGARARAVASGVPASVLARGDSSVARAGRLAARQRTAAAAAQLSTASTLWSSAAAEPRIAPTPAPAPDTVATTASDLARPPAPPAPRPAAPKPPPADPAPQIRALFEEYGSAIESRSVDAVRRAYPGLTPAQTREWEEFFRGVSDIEVELHVTALEVTGDSAEARLAGLYVFDNPSTRRTQRESVTFQARLRREGDRWRIASLR